MQHRWEGDVHYYDYDAASVQRMIPVTDSFTVAEAFIYGGPGAGAPVCVSMVVSGQALLGLSMTDAIAAAQRILPTLVAKHRPEAKGLASQITYLYTHDGRLVRKD